MGDPFAVAVVAAEPGTGVKFDAFQQMVDRMYEHGNAINMASHLEIDDVIDPADSRTWIRTLLTSGDTPDARRGKKRPNIDTW